MEGALQKLVDAYAVIGDGVMDGCLGEKCPDSCCRNRQMVCAGGHIANGKVLLFGRDEAFYQQDVLRPSITDLGGRVNIGTVRGIDRHRPVYLLDQCQRDDGSCKFELRKPLICRLFPFNLDADYPIAGDCGQVLSICGNEELLGKIMAVRTLLGCEDNEPDVN